MNVTQFAEHFAVCTRTVRRMIERGTVAAVVHCSPCLPAMHHAEGLAEDDLATFQDAHLGSRSIRLSEVGRY